MVRAAHGPRRPEKPKPWTSQARTTTSPSVASPQHAEPARRHAVAPDDPRHALARRGFAAATPTRERAKEPRRRRHRPGFARPRPLAAAREEGRRGRGPAAEEF